MKIKELFLALSKAIKEETYTPDFWRNVALLKSIIPEDGPSRLSSWHQYQGSQLLGIIRRIERENRWKHLQTIITALVDSHSRNIYDEDFRKNVKCLKALIQEYGDLKCSDRPWNLSEARVLLVAFQKQELVKMPKAKQSYRHHATTDDDSGCRPVLVLGGAFEMNRRRH